MVNSRDKERLVENEENKEAKDYDTVEQQSDECEYSCSKIWHGYKSCIEFTIYGVYSMIRGIGNAISACFGCCCYPIKERFSGCCDNCDTDLNPYKNPNYNPYDHL